MKPTLLLPIGIALLAFSALGYYGNFIQWIDAGETTARIRNQQEQWLRKGGGNLNLDLSYTVDGEPRSGTAQLAPATLEAAVTGNEIQVYYLTDNPDRVVPVVLLHKKQRTIKVTAALGLLATLIGLIGRQLRRRRSPRPGETPPGAPPADPAPPGN